MEALVGEPFRATQILLTLDKHRTVLARVELPVLTNQPPHVRTVVIQLGKKKALCKNAGQHLRGVHNLGFDDWCVGRVQRRGHPIGAGAERPEGTASYDIQELAQPVSGNNCVFEGERLL